MELAYVNPRFCEGNSFLQKLRRNFIPMPEDLGHFATGLVPGWKGRICLNEGSGGNFQIALLHRKQTGFGITNCLKGAHDGAIF